MGEFNVYGRTLWIFIFLRISEYYYMDYNIFDKIENIIGCFISPNEYGSLKGFSNSSGFSLKLSDITNGLYLFIFHVIN